MTRDQIVAEAARRLGDTSTEFKAEVDSAFDFVLSDLAHDELIGDLRQKQTATINASQRDYDTQTISGVAAPYYPTRIFSIRVWAWGAEGFISRAPHWRFELERVADGDATTGRPRFWSVWPNDKNMQLHPPADATNAGASMEVEFMAPPSIITGPTEITDLRFEDLETVVNGLIARHAGFKDESLPDVQAAFALYIDGKNRMYSRVHGNREIHEMRPIGP